MRRLAGLLSAICIAATFTGIARAETPLRIAVVSRTIFYLPAWTAETASLSRGRSCSDAPACSTLKRSWVRTC